jgi:hypothetical protein
MVEIPGLTELERTTRPFWQKAVPMEDPLVARVAMPHLERELLSIPAALAETEIQEQESMEALEEAELPDPTETASTVF